MCGTVESQVPDWRATVVVCQNGRKRWLLGVSVQLFGRSLRDNSLGGQRTVDEILILWGFKCTGVFQQSVYGKPRIGIVLHNQGGIARQIRLRTPGSQIRRFSLTPKAAIWYIWERWCYPGRTLLAGECRFLLKCRRLATDGRRQRQAARIVPGGSKSKVSAIVNRFGV